MIDQSLAQPAQPVAPDLRIEVPVEEELLAAVECALEWIEDRARHQDPDHAFGGEGRVEHKLRRALAEVWLREELQRYSQAPHEREEGEGAAQTAAPSPRRSVRHNDNERRGGT